MMGDVGGDITIAIRHGEDRPTPAIRGTEKTHAMNSMHSLFVNRDQPVIALIVLGVRESKKPPFRPH